MNLIKKTLMAGVSASMLTSQIFAVTASTSTKKLSTLESLRESKFDANIYSENAVDRKGIKTTGFSSVQEFTFGYNPTENDQLSVKIRTGSVTPYAEKMKGTYRYTELRYKKQNILSEKEDGVSMYVQGRIAAYAPKYRNVKSSNGHAALWVNFSKSFLNEKLSTSLLFVSKVYSTKAKAEVLRNKEKVVASAKYAIASVGYKISDKFSAGIDVLTLQDEQAKGNNIYNTRVILYPSVGYSATKRLSFTFFLETLATDENDSYPGFKSGLYTDASYNLAISYSIF